MVSGIGADFNFYQNYRNYKDLNSQKRTDIFPSFGFNSKKALTRLTETVKPENFGYMGKKLYPFPISNKLNPKNYPDVTQEVEKLRKSALEELKSCGKLSWLNPKVLKLFLKNLSGGKPWDIKCNPHIPGRTPKEQTQYAMYKGRIVSANYLSNNFYGQLCAAAGIPLSMAQFLTKVEHKGILKPLTKGEFPTIDALKLKDPPWDEDAVASGYNDFLHNKPWLKDFDPSRPHPDVKPY